MSSAGIRGGWERIGTLRGKPQTNRNLEGFLNASVDAALAMQTFILAAEACGLGWLPDQRHPQPDAESGWASRPARRRFPLSRGFASGYPAGKGYVSLRLPASITVHTDRYDDTAMPEALAAYDLEREARNPTPREKQRAPERYDYAESYGWSEDKARQAAHPEGAAFAAHILDTGFDFSNWISLPRAT